ncbi:M81 family metallopeptidase [Mesorhizobium sp. LNJC394B00]|uniref:M81 family metallopeptidase n=1 Tax=Mesorhizobium sp. LNJC394B00 TaxID=1287274 RepID=UPI0003CF8E13|nr:M81 family metallopeptidase [Mesorhizobium sp. LNJC394B00]ESY15314.1 Microcystin LR degradation protein MlrC [Mesorhizobium sp. LNJC394B00]
MTFTVLTAEFSTESNTFNENRADYDAFHCLLGDNALKERGDANTELAGFGDCARDYSWKQIHVLSASADCFVVTRDAFDRLGGAIVAAAAEHKPKLDGILLGLHGAMVTEFCEDGEGELLDRLRAAVGPSIPIAITLDPHANVTPKMCELANIVVSDKTYPHVEMRKVGRQAGDILQRAMKGEIRPCTLRVHPPMLREANSGRTDVGPMIDRIAKAIAYENEPGVFAVSINSGFGCADIREVGPTVTVTYDGNEAKHRVFAESIADDIWEKRFDIIDYFMPVEEAADIAKGYKSDKGPLIIADYADNPGAGAYGDSTNLLKALLDVGITDAAFGPMFDPETAKQLHRHKASDHVKVKLGGKSDPRFGGTPLELEGEVRLISDGSYTGDGPQIGGLHMSFGQTAVLRVGGIEILIVSGGGQMLDLQQFRAFGIDPAAKAVVALKSQQHFRAAFEPIAGKIILCDSGALCTTHLDKLPYRKVPRPIFPIDRDMTIEQAEG